MAVIGNAPFQGLVSGGNIIDASIEGVDLSTSAIAARLGYTPVDPGAAAIIGGTINGTTIGATTAASGAFTTVLASGAVTLNSGTASTALALDASKNVVSVTNTGSGNNVLATSPTLVTPVLGTPTSGNFSTGTFTWPTFNQNTTGTAAGLSATLATASGGTGLTAFTSGGIVYASSTGALATGSALTFDGTKLTSTTLSIAGPTGPVTASNERITVSNSYDGTVLGKMYAAPATNQKYLNAGWNVSTYGSGASGYMINGVTGIYRSSAGSSLYVAADQHLFGSLSADGFTNASPTFAEYMRITSAGNVGIGNTNPGAKLVVSGSGNIVRLGDGTNTFDVRFQGPNNWAQQLDTTNDVMNFQRNSISLVTFTSGGKVGIGTTGPIGKLSVLGAFGTDTTAGLAITSTGQTTGLVAPMAFYLQSTDWGTVHQANIYAQQVSGTEGGANILFSTATTGQFAPTERMRITSAGNLGVGTGIQANANYQFGQSLTDSYGTIPNCTIGRRLGVTGSANSPVISLGYYSSAYGMDLWVGTTGLSPVYLDVRQNESLIFRNNTFTGTARETMRISSAGGLSIGSTVNPGAGNILLPGTSGTIFANDTTNSRSYIELYNTSTGDMSLATTYTTASIRFLTGGTTTPTERMRIASTGRVSINNGEYTVIAGSVYGKTPNGTGFSFGYNPSGGLGEAQLVWGNGGSTYPFIICSSDGTTTTERIRITTAGQLTFPAASNALGISWDNYANVFGEYSSGATYLSSNYYPTPGAAGYKTTITATYGAAGMSLNGTGGTSNSGLIQFFVNPQAAKTAGAAFTPIEVARFRNTGVGQFLVGSTSTTTGAAVYVAGGIYRSQVSNGGTGAAYHDTGYLYGPDDANVYAGIRFLNEYLGNVGTAMTFWVTNNTVGSATEVGQFTKDGSFTVGNSTTRTGFPYKIGAFNTTAASGSTPANIASVSTGGAYGAAYVSASNPGFDWQFGKGAQTAVTTNFEWGTNGGGGSVLMSLTSAGNLTVLGSLSKGSGSFVIDHPLPAMEETHHLVHSFIEGPQADLIYRGRVNLVNGRAEVNIDTASTMTDGTFVALCRDVQCYTSNESDWIHVRGFVTGNILTIEAQDSTATSSISWMVIGERQDKHMLKTEWTDNTGKIIVEPTKVSRLYDPTKDPMNPECPEYDPNIKSVL